MPSYNETLIGSDSDECRIFELEPGSVSHDAAVKLAAIFRSMPSQIARLSKDNTSRHRSEAARNRFEQLVKTHPGLLQPLGFLDPATSILIAIPGARPRAYQDYPQVAIDETGQNYLMFVPVDYKKSAFVPKDARQLSVKGLTLDELSSLLGRFQIVVDVPDRGIEMPGDFMQSKHLFKNNEAPTSTETVFIAEGRSLDIVDDFRLRLELHVRNGGNSLDRQAPRIWNYPELVGDFVDHATLERNPQANVPRIDVLAGRTLLVYQTTVGNNCDFVPPDAIHFDTGAYSWLQSDKYDLEAGLIPPPMPPALEKYIKGGMGCGTVLTPEPPRRMMQKPGL